MAVQMTQTTERGRVNWTAVHRLRMKDSLCFISRTIGNIDLATTEVCPATQDVSGSARCRLCWAGSCQVCVQRDTKRQRSISREDRVHERST